MPLDMHEYDQIAEWYVVSSLAATLDERAALLGVLQTLALHPAPVEMVET